MDLGAAVKLKSKKLLHRLVFGKPCALHIRRALRTNQLQTDEFGDAVIAMHHIVAGLETKKRILGASTSKRSTASAHGRTMQHLAGGNEKKRPLFGVEKKPARKMADGKRDRARLNVHRQQLSHARTLAVAFTNDHRDAPLRQRRDLARRLGRVLAEDGNRARTKALRSTAR